MERRIGSTGLRTVSDVMTRTVVSVRASAPFKDVVRLMHDYRVSALPVVDDEDRLVGLVSEGDLILKEDPELEDAAACSRAASTATIVRRRPASSRASS
jgi:CBS-domain-containing membrane protein